MIKFRGVPLEDTSDIDEVEFDGTFVYGNYIKYGGSAVIVGDALEVGEDRFWPSWWVPVNHKTVEQFTGMQDVNGDDIYEGDIIVSKPTEPKYEPLKIGLVKRSKARAGWCYGTATATGEYNIWTSGKYRTYEIIGNVHDNQELLVEKHA